jgi:hypothetical protein
MKGRQAPRDRDDRGKAPELKEETTMPYVNDAHQSTFFPLPHALLRATPQEKESYARLSRRPRFPEGQRAGSEKYFD